MIFFVGNGGTVIKGLPSPVYQGSANANTVYLIAPFASNTQVTLAFKLPNGTVTEPAAMTAQGALEGVKNGQTGQTYAGWTYDLPNAVTALYGVAGGAASLIGNALQGTFGVVCSVLLVSILYRLKSMRGFFSALACPPRLKKEA